jgi:hypothetical protein
MLVEEIDLNSGGFESGTPRKKIGRPQKFLKDRQPRKTKPIVRKENSYSKAKIEEVMLFMIHENLPRLAPTGPSQHGSQTPPLNGMNT